jgi:hypothetical protein
MMLRKQEETMAHYPYLIIGGGMTAAAAIRGPLYRDWGSADD